MFLLEQKNYASVILCTVFFFFVKNSNFPIFFFFFQNVCDIISIIIFLNLHIILIAKHIVRVFFSNYPIEHSQIV